ncbi:hypothetical protein QKT49_gp349 [Acanthamoeba castellanii medusavirus]|uniref:Uncharacterized protein n=1 Tax=Acanthamoeba castellanii medusavirus J1 TaxID=3114988 RepID=A0A3T1CX67_9VIRU|nr:hypothetical protein QKT49_gp349 [Acanthamoeba castellanii medusavirus]BBI30414.1 hypothetical protein [Acanthamoeba castellanii medusavirus J1]
MQNRRHIEVGVETTQETNWHDNGITFSSIEEVIPINTDVSVRGCGYEFTSERCLYADGRVETRCRFVDDRNGVRVEWKWSNTARHPPTYRLWLATNTTPLTDRDLLDGLHVMEYDVRGHRFHLPQFQAQVSANDAMQDLRDVLDAYFVQIYQA